MIGIAFPAESDARNFYKHVTNRKEIKRTSCSVSVPTMSDSQPKPRPNQDFQRRRAQEREARSTNPASQHRQQGHSSMLLIWATTRRRASHPLASTHLGTRFSETSSTMVSIRPSLRRTWTLSKVSCVKLRRVKLQPTEDQRRRPRLHLHLDESRMPNRTQPPH